MLKLNRIKYVFHYYYSTNAKPFEEIPSPKGLPFVGTLFSFIAAGGSTQLHEYIDKRHQQLGIIFQEKLGPISSVFLNDVHEIRKVFVSEGKYPKHVLPECWLLYNKMKGYQRGLYFMDGEEWYMYRRLLNDKLLKYDYYGHGIQNDLLLQKTFEIWLQKSKYVMMSFTLGRSFHDNVDKFLPNIEKLALVVKDIFKWSVKLSILPATLASSLNLPVWNNFVTAVDESIKLTKDLLEGAELKGSDGILYFLLNKNIPIDVTQRIIVDFLLAAGDTTALATLWILYLLGRHKNIQDELYNDIEKNRDGHDTRLLQNVIRESMRLYPIAPFIARYLPQETEIASYLIPANHLISISVFNCSRNEKYFPDANKFEPKRWDRLANGKYAQVNDPYATLPYGMGARSCIGRNLSKVQISIIVNKLIASYELEVRNKVGVKLNMVTTPSQPIKLLLKKR